MQCGLDGGPNVTDGCWRAVRVTVKGFDEISGRGNRAVLKTSRTNRTGLDTRVPVELFLFLVLSH